MPNDNPRTNDSIGKLIDKGYTLIVCCYARDPAGHKNALRERAFDPWNKKTMIPFQVRMVRDKWISEALALTVMHVVSDSERAACNN